MKRFVKRFSELLMTIGSCRFACASMSADVGTRTDLDVKALVAVTAKKGLVQACTPELSQGTHSPFTRNTPSTGLSIHFAMSALNA